MNTPQHQSTTAKSRKHGFFRRIICCVSPDITEDSPPRITEQHAEKSQSFMPQRETPVESTAAPTTLVEGEKKSSDPYPITNIQNPLSTEDGRPDTNDDITPTPGSPSIPQTETTILSVDQPLVPSSSTPISTTPTNAIIPVDINNTLDSQDLDSTWLLPPIAQALKGRKCLVLDLDETLVHSSFKVIHQADFVVPVEIDGIFHNVYVIKRPGVDDFMRRVGERFEVVVFTASLSKYADPVLDILDIHHVVHHRLFRESCFNHMGNYVKDLSQLGRDLREVIIIDNSPASYVFHPAHAVPISSWFNDIHDTELIDLIPFLLDLTTVNDVSQVLELSL